MLCPRAIEIIKCAENKVDIGGKASLLAAGGVGLGTTAALLALKQKNPKAFAKLIDMARFPLQKPEQVKGLKLTIGKGKALLSNPINTAKVLGKEVATKVGIGGISGAAVGGVVGLVRGLLKNKKLIETYAQSGHIQPGDLSGLLRNSILSHASAGGGLGLSVGMQIGIKKSIKDILKEKGIEKIKGKTYFSPRAKSEYLK